MAKKTFRYVVIDVFTDKPLTGNQLAVFTDAREIPEDILQPLAREMAFSETVFCYPGTRQERPPARSSAGDQLTGEEAVVYPLAEGGHVRIRIFTPAAELPFAGHPLLGSAFVLAGPLQLLEIRIETGVGIVPVLLEREGDRIVFGRMRQPVPAIALFERAPELLAALGVERSELPVEVYDNGMPHVYVILRDEQAVAALEPDMAALARLQLSWGGAKPFGANCSAGVGRRWKTRMFSPADGVPEDAATGSAAGPLACHVGRHGLVAFGDEIEISQGVELKRPSVLYARVEGSAHAIEAVEVGGSAVVVARGEFRL
jgi:trans-2,3-dihydro-3-hydroxyanthranilate isomerase